MNIKRILQKRDFEVKIKESNISTSKYYYISHPNLDEELKIRRSNHAPKPTYEQLNGAADFEIGNHQAAHSKDWYGALTWIFQKANVERPDWLKDEIKNREEAINRRIRDEAKEIDAFVELKATIEANINKEYFSKKMMDTKELSKNRQKKIRPEIIQEAIDQCDMDNQPNWQEFRRAFYRVINFK